MPGVHLTEKDHALVERSRTLLKTSSLVRWIWLIHPVLMVGVAGLCVFTFFLFQDVMSWDSSSERGGSYFNFGFALGLGSGCCGLSALFGLRDFFTDRTKRKADHLIVKLYEEATRQDDSNPVGECNPHQTGDKT